MIRSSHRERLRRAGRKPSAKSRDNRFTEACHAGTVGEPANQLTGVGVVFGLEGTGDTKSTPQTQQAISNALRRFGLNVDATAMSLKNVAIGLGVVAVVVVAYLGFTYVRRRGGTAPG